MEANTIVKGNKMVAEFMGATPFGSGIDFSGYEFTDSPIYNSVKKLYHFEDIEYHTSWDWLMPVVEKIQSLACNVNIINNYCQIIKFESGDTPPSYQRTQTMAHTKIENVYNAVVQFITWYNQQQSSKK